MSSARRAASIVSCAPDALNLIMQCLNTRDVAALSASHRSMKQCVSKFDSGNFVASPLQYQTVARFAPVRQVAWFIQNLAIKTARQKALFEEMTRNALFIRAIAQRSSKEIVHVIERKLRLLQGDNFVGVFAHHLIARALYPSAGIDPEFISFLISLYPWAIRSSHIVLSLRLGISSICNQLVRSRKMHGRASEIETILTSRTVMQIYARCDPALLNFLYSHCITQRPDEFCSTEHVIAFLYRYPNDKVQLMLELMRRYNPEFLTHSSQISLIKNALHDADLSQMIGSDNICRSLAVFFQMVDKMKSETKNYLLLHNPRMLMAELMAAKVIEEPDIATPRCPTHSRHWSAKMDSMLDDEE